MNTPLTPMFKVVEIETASACNRACSYCPNSIAERPSQGFMADELYHKIIDELADLGFSGRLSFHFYNEPLLDRRLPALIASAHRRLSRARIVLYTNGDLLTAGRLRELRSAGVSRFIVTAHEGGSRVAGLLDTLGADERAAVSFQSHQDLVLTNRGGLLTQLGRKGLPLRATCTAPSVVLVITLTGNVVLCYEDYLERVVLGNVATDTIASVWMSQKFRDLRDRLAAADRSATGICAACTNVSHSGYEAEDVF